TNATVELLQLIAARGVYFGPRLLAARHLIEHRKQFVATDDDTEADFALMEQKLPATTEMFTEAVQIQGLKLVWGTGATAGAHGRNAEEFIYRVRDGGQSAMAALTSAQSVAADAIGLGHRIGTLK